jgi:hypothetical protein
MHSFSADALPPGSTGGANVLPWKSIPEDSGPWRRAPFKNPELPRALSGKPLPGYPAGSASDLVLQGIMKSDAGYYAVLNGLAVQTGDVVDGWTIVTISRDRVITRREKEKQVHDIYQGRIDRGTR